MTALYADYIVCHIAPPEWLNTPALDALRAALAPAPLYAVGGCVRNHLWGLPVADIDLATPCPPADVCKALEVHGIQFVPTGMAHGTVTAILAGQGFEITSFRHDRLPDGRHAQVDFTPDMATDGARRDFTVNALYLDATGGLYDPNGTGVIDIENKKLRFIGDPSARIMEDHLRLLRYFRFFSHYGYGDMDADSLSACIELKDNLKNISRERVTREIEILLKGKHAARVLQVMLTHNILPDFLSEIFNPDVYTRLQNLWLLRPDLVPDMALLAFCVWRNDINLIISKASQWIVFTAKNKKTLEGLYRCLVDTPDKYKKNIYVYGEEITRMTIIFKFIINDLSVNSDRIFNDLACVKNQPVPQFPCSSAQLMSISGLGAGQEFGYFRARVEKFWLETDCEADRDACEAFAKSIL